ncbi:protein timeless homolog [Brienomyrus brachyistius]|uniref:protein timeless homolog n=1 Tax=Brienomyrus brachyistius TaxID=42636 RepID=UPI0020B35B41|nr:protein timeless homolog [Brienomyrus brachyistius]XP_048856124.1 protein timeless homolog [Brienomyrus brachyistius]
MDLYMMNCELLATCSALGYLEGDIYHRESDCLESVKDLIRYLRHEDDTRDIRQQLGAAQILQNDLLPIITQHSQDKPLFDACIRLMVNLTQPALLCFGKVPQDPTFRHHFLQVVSYLQAYKEAFASEKVFGLLSETLYGLLQLEWQQRQEEDNLLIERILLLLRNVLHVPADPYDEKNVDDDASVHDKLLWAIHMSGMDDLLKFLASAQSEQHWSMHVLEVISLMFRDQTPELLVSAGQARSAQEKQKDAQELELLRLKEQAEKRGRSLQRGTRHSRFGGSYVVQGLKSIGDKDVIYHRGLHSFKNYTHDAGKVIRRVPKRRQMAKDVDGQRRSALNVRRFLRDFCIDFLENCYNRLMFQVKECLIREQAQQHDETYFLWALSFFMAFNRGHTFRPDLVSETMSIRAFHFIERNITNYYEMMLTDRKEATSWSSRMHLALKAYQELLLTVNEMDRSQDESIRQSANVVKSNIFYLMEYREIFLTLLRKFDETKQPRSFLRDLVESTHLFLRMLERFCKGRNNLVVQRKKVRRRKSGGRRKQPAMQSTPEALEETWQLVSEELRAAGFQLSESLTEGAVPFDAASEIPLEEQRTEAMVRIQDALLVRQGPEALSLLRAAREVWPEGDVFGSADVEPEEEMQLLNQILFADLPRAAPAEVEEEDGVEEIEEEEELESVSLSEKEFNFIDYVKRFANPAVVRPYLLLLKCYSQNTAHTNHCITRMLHRLAVDLKMDALLFQLSVFQLFHKILGDPASAAYKELVTFIKFVLNRFFALAARNNKAYVELLFWKNVGTVREMTEGYRKPEDEDGNRRAKWSPEETEELRRLYEEQQDSGVPDIVETLLPLLSNTTRTRRHVITQLVNMGLVDSAKDLKKERKGTRIVLWTEEQEFELQTLFEEYRHSDDILGNIMRRLTARRSRARVVDKLLSLGLVSERKELYKKRRCTAVGKSNGMTEEDFFSDLAGGRNEQPSDDDDDDDDDDEEDDLGQSDDEEVPTQKSLRHQERPKRTRGMRVEKNLNLGPMVQSLRQEGMSGPILWLQNCLNRTADCREEDGVSQAVPLVPLTEENEDAMEAKSFQRLLHKLGVREPADEQETFWRIPAKLSASQLRAAAAALSVSEEAPAEEEQGDVEGSPVEEHDESETSHEQRVQALRALLLERKRKVPAGGHRDESPTSDDPELDPDTEAPRAPKESRSSVKRSRVLHSDDEAGEDVSENHREPSSDEDSLSIPAKRRRHRVLIDDDDDED